MMTATAIQTIAAVIQAAAAFVFLLSVVYDARRRRRTGEQEQRDAIIKALHFEFTFQPGGQTSSEAAGLFSSRQIEFFNTRLKELGESWTYINQGYCQFM
jgi:hypothetical protein